MINESRIDIYDYLTGLFSPVGVAVYPMEIPQELTENDTKNGFIVVSIGDVNDASEFKGNAFGWTRAYVETYIPPKSRGRLDKARYKTLETAVTTIINAEVASRSTDMYSIEEDSFLSLDATEDTNANNLYHLFVKSFIVTLNSL